MKTRFIEVTNRKAPGVGNWGKFLLVQFEAQDYEYRSEVGDGGLLTHVGWGIAAHRTNYITVIDLQTGEGATFRHGGNAKFDLDKHRVWVCPMYEPFLTWLYRQDLTDLDALPALVDLDAPGELRGYRRQGPRT